MDTIKVNVAGVEVEVDKEQLSKGIDEGSVVIESDAIKVFDLSEKEIDGKKTNDFELFQNNITKEPYERGKIAGEEMAVKSGAEEYGLELETKDFKSFATALKGKFEKTAEPNEKINELKSDKEKLQGQLGEWENKYNGIIQERETEKNNLKINGTIGQSIPSDKLEIKLDKATALFKMDYEVGFDEDGEYVKDSAGNIQKHENTLQRKKVSDVMPDWLTTNNFVKKPTGGNAGGDNTGGNAPGSIDAFNKQMQNEGIKPGSESYNLRMQQAYKDGTLKI